MLDTKKPNLSIILQILHVYISTVAEDWEMSKIPCNKKLKTKDSCAKIGHLLRFAMEYFRPAKLSVWVRLGITFWCEHSLNSWNKKWDFSLGLLGKFIVSQVVCLGMAALQGAALSLPCLGWVSESPGSGLVCQGVGGTVPLYHACQRTWVSRETSKSLKTFKLSLLACCSSALGKEH